MRIVDRFDGRIDIRVGSEENTARERIDFARPCEHLAPQHAGHSLIADQHAPVNRRGFSIRVLWPALQDPMPRSITV